jgi:hypothetical protein
MEVSWLDLIQAGVILISAVAALAAVLAPGDEIDPERLTYRS